MTRFLYWRVLLCLTLLLALGHRARAMAPQHRTLQADSAVTTAPDSQQAVPADSNAGVPVVIGTDTIFSVYARIGSFTAQDRAAAIQARIARLAADPYIHADSLRLMTGDASDDIVLGDVVVLSITNADAQAVHQSRAALAATYMRAVHNALQGAGVAEHLRAIALGLLFTLIVAIIVLLVFSAIQRIFPRLFIAIEQGRGHWIPAIRIQRFELVSAERVTDTVLWIARALRIVLLVLLLYLSIPVVLSFFPWTRRYAHQLFEFTITPFVSVWTSFVTYLPHMFTVLVIGVVSWYLVRVIRLFFIGVARERITVPGFFPDWAMPTYQLVRVLVILFAVIAMWPYLPWSDSPAFKGVGVFVGLLVSLGSASAVGNVIGGIVLTYMRPFQVGDRVQIAETVGDVVEKNLLITRVRTIKNVSITIPNAMVLSSHIINYSASTESHRLILHTTVSIGYDTDWRQIHKLLLSAARKTQNVLEKPEPFVLQTSLDDFYVSYQINAYTDKPSVMAQTYSALHANIQSTFQEANVEIMSPHYNALRDGNAPAIPGQPNARASTEA